MSRKNLALSSIALVLITVIIILSYEVFHLRQDPKVYNFTIETDDLRIKDIEFVVIPGSNSMYVSDHILERVWEDNQISDVTYGISIDGKMLLSLSQAGDPFTLPDASKGMIHYTTNNLITNVNARTDDKIKIEIKYKVNGVATNKVSTVKLENLIKPFTTTGEKNKNIIHL